MTINSFNNIRSESYQTKPIKNFIVSYVKSNFLLPHEQIIEKNCTNVLENIKKTKTLKRPLLVSNEDVILDGHHRFEALKRLNIRQIPIIRIDYLNDSPVKLRSWYPILNTKANKLIKLLNSNNYEVKHFQRIIDKNLKLNEDEILFGNLNECYKILGKKKEVYPIILKNQKNIKYVDNIILAFQTVKDRGITVVFGNYKKNQILKIAQNETLLPPKSTRHVLKYQFPNQPIKLNTLLKESK